MRFIEENIGRKKKSKVKMSDIVLPAYYFLYNQDIYFFHNTSSLTAFSILFISFFTFLSFFSYPPLFIPSSIKAHKSYNLV